jgi:GTP-binding protein
VTERVRNIGIIAHVDHGKTTLIDRILEQCDALGRGGLTQERVMDSNDLERERGITILSKNTAVRYQDQPINIVDTPGHADFGAEVERILRMVDCVLLLVDAAEGPMPQTRFVLRKSLDLGHRPIVVINKIDRADGDPDRVLNDVFDLFVTLDANEDQLEFPVIYASGRDGYAGTEPNVTAKTLEPLLDMVLQHVPPCELPIDGPLQLQVATLDRDDFMGRIAIGRIYRGQINNGDRLIHIATDGKQLPFRVSKLMGFSGMDRVDIQSAVAGDIVALAGVGDVTVGETLCAPALIDPLPAIPIDPPTLAMEMSVNDSPWAGREGKFVTSRHLRDRLARELEHNVSLTVTETDRPEVQRIAGRGTLSLSILIETMRREGYEMQLSPPEVIIRMDDQGRKLEPYERVVAECNSDYSGIVIEKLSKRGGELTDMRAGEDGTTRMEFRVPARGLIGYRSMYLSDTRGTGVLYHVFAEYARHRGTINRRDTGVMIALELANARPYSLFNLQQRGTMLIGPGDDVYGGMVVGIAARAGDLVVNPGKGKKLSNVRSSGADEKLILTPKKPMTLEDALEFIDNDELVEVTPTSIRLRKRYLDHSNRRRYEKKFKTA